MDYAHWQDAWRALGAEADERLYAELLARYGEPHRRYHTLAHLAFCLARFDEARALAARPGEIALALWFHDAIYDPRRTDNEARSAAWARTAADAAGLPAEVGTRIHGLVMATRHDATPQEGDARLVVDVDLAILGSAAERFDQYEQGIRAEYAWLSDADFRAGRSALLRRLLGRPRIYATDFFFGRYETQARGNLSRALSRLNRG